MAPRSLNTSFYAAKNQISGLIIRKLKNLFEEMEDEYKDEPKVTNNEIPKNLLNPLGI